MSDSLSFFARTRSDDRIGCWWLANDTALWQHAKTDLRRTFNHSTGLHYDPNEREWTIPLYSRDRLQRWADAWATRQEWNAARRGGGQNDDRSHEDAQGTPEVAVTTAYCTLHLLPSAPPELVTTAYRTLAPLHHPDRGGDISAMVALNQAIAILRRQGKAS